jgi:hypothetical protein
MPSTFCPKRLQKGKFPKHHFWTLKSNSLGHRYSKQYPAEAGDLRAAMAHLSAHTEETSDARYGGEEGTIYNFTQNDLDRFR